MDEFSFLIDDSEIIPSDVPVVGIEIGHKRFSESVRIWNDSELKSIFSGTGEVQENSSASIVSICEGRGSLSEIGLAIFDTQGSLCHIIQYADTSNYSRTMHLLTIHTPLRILMCSSATENYRSKLYQTLLNVFPLDSICFLNRCDFNEGKGREVIERLAFTKSLDSVLFACSKKYYAFSAVSALFFFIEHELSMSFSAKSIKFIVKPSDGTLSLELVSNNGNPRSLNCLFGVICKCRSPMGRRLLRSCILQPLTDLVEINERQEAIQCLIEHEIFMNDLREALKIFPDIDNFIGGLVRKENSLDPKSGENLIHKALILKKIIDRVKVISSVLENLSGLNPYLVSISEVLCDNEVSKFEDLISEVINEDIFYSERTNLQHHQRFYAVKSINNSLLEVARRTLKETQSDIYEYVEIWSSQIDLQVEIKYHNKRGYYLSISKSILGERSMEGICSQFKMRRNEVTFTTMDLIKLNGRVKESITEVLLASQAVLIEMFDVIRERVDIIYEISAAIARLDFICGLAQWSVESGSVCRPEFGDGSTGSGPGSLAIRNSRHPILVNRSIVANDYFSCRGNSFTVVTGANMSGKSTYSKQLALLCVLAQMGSLVPADYALFPIYDRILTRIGSDDELESNASSFRMEMKEASFILEMINDTSLVIIDELGRGTGYLEGMSLALCICDYILSRSEATVMFVTHFSQLVNYLKLHPKVSLIQLQTEVSAVSRDLRFLYRATSGIVDIENYGMKLAESVGLPADLISSAYRALDEIKRKSGHGSEHSGIRSTLYKRKLIFKTAEKIKYINESLHIDEKVKKSMLAEVKEEFDSKLENLVLK